MLSKFKVNLFNKIYFKFIHINFTALKILSNANAATNPNPRNAK